MSKHNHSIDAKNSNSKIILAIVINVFITVFEIISGVLSGSLALISDALHNFTDVGGMSLSLFGEKIKNKEGNTQKTYGYKRAEIIIAFINSLILTGTVLFILYEAVKRISHPEMITGNTMLITATIALVGNGIATYLLEKDAHENLNLKSAWLHSLQDALFSLGVIAGAILIKVFGWYIIDPFISIFLSVFVLKETYSLFNQALNVLMESVPKDINFEKVRESLKDFKGVNEVHDLHIWQTDSSSRFLSVHLDIDNLNNEERNELLCKIQGQMDKNYQINHLTIQMVSKDDKSTNLNCNHCN